jgi:SSS family solute:Na+ symporter
MFAAIPIPHITNSLTLVDTAVIAFPIVVAFIVTLYMKRYMRSVADYLAAGRSAGRYLISTAQMEMGITAAGVAGAMEQFSQTGYSLNLWGGFTGFFYFLLAMSGVITYRFRETRSLTFHQFFEVRYSKGLRVFATLVNVISSLLTLGIGPVVAARFFVYFLGLPVTTNLGFMTAPTTALVMIVVTGMAVYFAFAGGHLTIMTTDCIEGVISSFMYLMVALSILWLFSYREMGDALKTGLPGMSYLDPFDIDKRPNFNFTFIILGWLQTMYFWRGNAWNPSFVASGKTAHESQMAVVLGVWRSMAGTAMGGLIGLGAFTIMHSPDFSGYADSVQTYLKQTLPLDTDAQLRTQLMLPTALGVLLPIGVKGALAAALLMGFIAATSAALFNFSNGLIQDLVLPLKKERLSPSTHIWVLRLTAVGIAIYSIFFGLCFRFNDYLTFISQLMSAIYLGGIGIVVWGGLYWKRGTNAAAWGSMFFSLFFASIGLILQEFWTELVPFFTRLTGPGPWADYMHANATKFPINGQYISVSVMGICLVTYVVVSFMTCRTPHDMDRLLHRGKYRIAGEDKIDKKEKWSLRKFAGVNDNFSLGDRRIAYFTFWWGLLPNLLGIGVIIWNLGFHRWTLDGWWAWTYFWGVAIPVVGGIITTIWFTWGVTKDLRTLFRDLKNEKIDVTDDGQFVGHESDPAAPKH